MKEELGATINDESSGRAAIRQQKRATSSQRVQVEDGGRITRERESERVREWSRVQLVVWTGGTCAGGVCG